MKFYFLPVFLLLGVAFSFGQAVVQVIPEKAKVRSLPHAKASAVVTVKQDESLEVLEISGSWYKVKAGARVGWIHGNSVRSTYPLLERWGDPKSVREYGGMGTGPGTGTGTGGGQGSGIGNGQGSGRGTGSEIRDDAPDSELRFVDKPRAVYTEVAKRNGVQGSVKLKVTFLASGEIGEIVPVTFLPDGLTEQAVTAAKRIRFRPKRVNGVPTTVVRFIEYNFSVY